MRGSWLRQTALTNNIANADTPNYRPQEVDFESTLQTAMQGEARVLQHEQDRSVSLLQRGQQLHRYLAHASDPAALAAQAKALHMHPQVTPLFIRRGSHGRLCTGAAGAVHAAGSQSPRGIA